MSMHGVEKEDEAEVKRGSYEKRKRGKMVSDELWEGQTGVLCCGLI